MTSLKKILPILGLLLTFPACAASTALSREPIEGVVLEAGTNKAIPGAIVIARWQGSSPVFIADSQTVCFHVETTTTDEQGRYRILPLPEEPRHRRIEDKRVITTAYKSGYRYTGGTKRVDYLQPFTGGREERLEQLSRFTGMQCGERENYAKQLIPLYRSIYEEAKSIAVTKEEKRSANNRLRDLEEMELGYDKAWGNWRIREKTLE